MTGPEETAREKHEGKIVRISELADGQGVVRNHDFLRCEIWGPGGPALVMFSGGTIHFNHVDGFPNDCFYEVEADRQRCVGAVIVAECSFELCTFMNVGFTGPSEHLRDFKASFFSLP